MSPRTLVAGAASPPSAPFRGDFVSSGDPRHAQFEADLRAFNARWKPENDVWTLFGDMWRLAWPRRELAERLARLTAQLDDPALRNHPRWHAAEARYFAWKRKLTIMDAEGERLTGALAKAWVKVPARTRAELQRQPGWSQAQDAKTFAAETWESARRGGPWPAGEAPF